MWRKTERGTNAPGLAVLAKAPVAIYGREHFFACHGHLSCMAAPRALANHRLQAYLALPLMANAGAWRVLLPATPPSHALCARCGIGRACCVYGTTGELPVSQEGHEHALPDRGSNHEVRLKRDACLASRRARKRRTIVAFEPRVHRHTDRLVVLLGLPHPTPAQFGEVQANEIDTALATSMLMRSDESWLANTSLQERRKMKCMLRRQTPFQRFFRRSILRDTGPGRHALGPVSA